MNDKHEEVSTVLKGLSAKDFLNIGLHQLAYIKPVEEGETQGFAIHAADGTQLSLVEDYQEAANLARLNALEPVTIH